MVTCTQHAFERGSRLGIYSEEKFANYAERAWNKGKKVSDFSGKARTYLLDIEKRHNENTVVRVFAGFCFIFNKSGRLITQYAVNSKALYSNRPKSSRLRGEDDLFASYDEDLIFINFSRGHSMSFFCANFYIIIRL